MLLDNMRSRFRGKRNGTVLILSNGTLSLLPSNSQELFEDSSYRYWGRLVCQPKNQLAIQLLLRCRVLTRRILVHFCPSVIEEPLTTNSKTGLKVVYSWWFQWNVNSNTLLFTLSCSGLHGDARVNWARICLIKGVHGVERAYAPPRPSGEIKRFSLGRHWGHVKR